MKIHDVKSLYHTVLTFVTQMIKRTVESAVLEVTVQFRCLGTDVKNIQVWKSVKYFVVVGDNTSALFCVVKEAVHYLKINFVAHKSFSSFQVCKRN
jgi:hypothetical protein